jgi:phytoene dehydrogenase-like protein
MTISKVLVIGGGVAGLSVGCYLQLSGFQTEIFEAHNKPGGLLTG